MPVC